MIGSDDLNLDEFKNKIEYLKEQPFYEIFYKHSQVSENYETSLSSLATYVDTVLQVDTVEAFNRNYKESVTYINLQSLCDQHNVDLQLYYNWYGTHNATDEVKAIRKSVNILKKRAQFLVKKMLKSLFPPTVVLPSPPKSKSKTSPTKKSDKDGDSFQDYTSDDEVSEVSSEFFQGLRIGQDVVSFNTPVRFDIADVIDPSSKVPDSEFVEPSTNRFSKRNNDIKENRLAGSDGLQDLYETQERDVVALLPYLNDFLELMGVVQPATAFECCCGNGSISKVLIKNGYKVIEWDKFTMEDSKDFLIDPLPDRFDIIISNTPYDKKELFFRRAIECGMPFALLLPLESLGNKKIAQMVEENGVVIGILTPQPKFLHNGELKSYPGVCGWFLGNFNDSKKIELFYIHT